MGCYCNKRSNSLSSPVCNSALHRWSSIGMVGSRCPYHVYCSSGLGLLPSMSSLLRRHLTAGWAKVLLEKMRKGGREILKEKGFFGYSVVGWKKTNAWKAIGVKIKNPRKSPSLHRIAESINVSSPGPAILLDMLLSLSTSLTFIDSAQKNNITGRAFLSSSATDIFATVFNSWHFYPVLRLIFFCDSFQQLIYSRLSLKTRPKN